MGVALFCTQGAIHQYEEHHLQLVIEVCEKEKARVNHFYINKSILYFFFVMYKTFFDYLFLLWLGVFFFCSLSGYSILYAAMAVEGMGGRQDSRLDDGPRHRLVH